MAQLTLHFQGIDRKPILVEDDVPDKGTCYTIHGIDHDGGSTVEHFIVSLVQREIWPKRKYAQGAPENEYLAGGNWGIVLVHAQDAVKGIPI